MKVILIKPVPKLGQPGDVVQVSPGYARNFLLAKSLAHEATVASLQALVESREHRREERAKHQQRLDKIKNILGGQTILVRSKANVEGVLFGGVDKQAIAAAIAKRKKIEINPKQLDLPHHLKTLGRHEVSLELGGGEKITFTVDVQRGE